MKWEGRNSLNREATSAGSGLTRKPLSAATSVAMIADPPELVTISIRGPAGGGT
jgi:hypothetical protein